MERSKTTNNSVCSCHDYYGTSTTTSTATTIYSHYTGQPALAGTPVKNWRILSEQSFTAHMPLMMALNLH